jgi:chromosome partitioning protein
MPIIALANLKGGVGKSTLAVSLAGALAPNSALIDADPQATASAWAEAGSLPFPVTESPLTGSNVEAWITDALNTDATYIVIDLPPMLGDATAAALAIADLAVIPVTASGADLKATNRAIELIAAARENRGDGKPTVLMVPSKVDIRTAAGAEIQAVLHDYGEPVGPVISQRVAHADAFTAGLWIGDYAKGSAAHSEIKALASVAKRLAGKPS